MKRKEFFAKSLAVGVVGLIAPTMLKDEFD